MTADTIRSYVRTNLFTDDKLQLEKASYSNIGGSFRILVLSPQCWMLKYKHKPFYVLEDTE